MNSATDSTVDGDLGETVVEYVREEPFTSLAIAGAVGFILGGGARSRIGQAALAIVGKTVIRGAATNLILGLVLPDPNRKAPERAKSRRRTRDERQDNVRHDNGRADIRNPG